MAPTLTPGNIAGLKVVKAQGRSQHINMLIYGDSGIGKTTLAGSVDAVPSMRPALLIDIEGGTESLRHSYPNIDVVRVSTWNEMQAVYDELHSGRTNYETIILDSLTEIQKFSMYQIMLDLIDKKDDADPDIPSMREWGKNIEQIRRLVRAFRDLPMNAIFTALTKDDKNPRTGKTKTMPSLSGKVSQEVPAFLDVVSYYYLKRLDDGTEVRLLLNNATESNIAKDRTGKLPMVMEEPSMGKIFEAILGESNNDTITTTEQDN